MQTTIAAPAVETVDTKALTDFGKMVAEKKVIKRPSKVAEKAAAKPAKEAAAKAPAKAKTATKAAPKKAAKVLNFTLMNRPGAGAPLFAYTDAVLTLTGLNKGKSVEGRLLKQAMGETAVRYHLNKGTFAQDDKGAITLTAGGRIIFADRAGKFDTAIRDAYMALIQKGEITDSVCKNAALLKAI